MYSSSTNTPPTCGSRLSEDAQKMLSQDIYAANLYESVVTDKFGTPFINEYEQKIVRL